MIQIIEFEMHPHLLVNAIKQQAGTLEKAVMEGVMNSIDAGATIVNITVCGTRVTIADDGKGFQSADEVRSYFAKFGTPHVEGDAVYGRFRMGRGQMFAFGKNEWRTGEFLMLVDVNHINSDKLIFSLEDSLDDFLGCNIKIDLYTPLTEREVYNITQGIKKMVRFTNVKVMVNGEQANKPPTQADFPESTEDAFIRIRPAEWGNIDIYNLGVFVESISGNQYGVSGTIVSKTALDVNFARNQVMSSCPVWKRVRKIIDIGGRQAVKRKTVLSEAERLNVIERIRSGDMQPRECAKMAFIKDTTGKAWSPDSILRRQFEYYSVAKANDRVADTLMQSSNVLILDQECIELLVDNPEDFVKLLKYSYNPKALPSFIQFDDISENIDRSFTLIPKAKISRKEKVWTDLIHYMMGKLGKPGIRGYDIREVRIGTSDTANAWTDGSTYVAFDRKFLEKKKMMVRGQPSARDIMDVLLVLVHEMCHDTDSRENIHSPDFYRAFHDMCFNTGTTYCNQSISDVCFYGTSYMSPARYQSKMKGEDISTEMSPDDIGEHRQPVDEPIADAIVVRRAVANCDDDDDYDE